MSIVTESFTPGTSPLPLPRGAASPVVELPREPISAPLAWLDDTNHWLPRVVLLLTPAMLAAVTSLLIPFSQPMPDYWVDALQFARTGIITQRFTPSGYPLTMALGPLLLPAHPQVGFLLEGVALHVCLTALLWGVLRRLGTGVRTALAGALLLQADPDLLTSVTKVWDVAFSTLLLLLVVFLALGLQSAQARKLPTHAALLGAAWAFGCFDRPNYAALLPVLLLGLWHATRGSREKGKQDSGFRFSYASASLLASAFAVYALCSLAAYRTVRTPGNGAYNLFAGHNSCTRGALLAKLNAEPSIIPALAQAGVRLGTRPPDALSLQPFYRGSARHFAAAHPREESLLFAIKLLTLLRPDTKLHPLASAAGLCKALLALPVPMWALTLLWLRQRRWALWSPSDTAVVLTAFLYTLPFLLTNSDPRFRTPLDALVLLHLASLLSRASPPKDVGGFAAVPQRSLPVR